LISNFGAEDLAGYLIIIDFFDHKLHIHEHEFILGIKSDVLDLILIFEQLLELLVEKILILDHVVLEHLNKAILVFAWDDAVSDYKHLIITQYYILYEEWSLNI
jgi:hypothetical protein